MEGAGPDPGLRSREEQLSEEKVAIARLQGDLSRVQGQHKASQQLSEVQDIIEGRLLAAQQELTDEMKRLQERQAYRRPPESPVGGIPVDSEYIIFIIDTSGSMQRFAWPQVRRKMEEVLDAYPRVKGLTGDSIDDVIATVDRLNRPDARGQRKVRIHAIGFPTIFSQAMYGERTGIRFATLMRLLCEKNGGTFVALNDLTP